MRNLIIGTAAALALSAGAASAASVSYTDGLPLSFTTTEISGTLSIPQFDDMGGTLVLTSVEWLVTGAIQGTILLQNGASNSALVSASTVSDLGLFSSSFEVGAAPQISLSAGTGFVNVPGGGSIGPIGVSDTGTFGTTQMTGLASFVGGGTVTIDYATLSGVSIQGGGGNVTGVQSTEGAAGLEVTYFYEERPTGEVPVPAALPLLATAIGALGIWRARRKA